MRSSHCRIAPPVVAAASTGVLALAPPSPSASLLRRSSGAALALGARLPPLARRLRAVAPEAVPAESRIVFRAGAVGWR